MIGPQFAGYSDIQPIPERPEAVDLGPDVLHPWTTRWWHRTVSGR